MHEAPRQVTQARSLQRRRAVLDAALACFSERGVEQASIEDICRRSSASVGSIYHHFGNKAGLAAALYVGVLEDFQRRIVRGMSQGADARRWIGSIVNAHLGWVDDHEAAARFLQTHRHAEWLASQSDQIRSLNAAFGAALAQAARRHIGAGVFRSLPIDIFIAALLGPTHEYIRARLAGRGVTPAARARRLLADVCWHALARDTHAFESKEPL